MDELHIHDLQSVSLMTASGIFYNITYIQISIGINGFPQCVVSLSTGGALHIDEATNIKAPTFPLLDEDCDLCYKLDGDTHVLFSGYIAGEQSSIQSTTDVIHSTRTYRIACVSEKIDAVPPMAVRYLSNAVAASQQVLHNFIMVTNNAKTGAAKALNSQSGNNDVGGLILRSLSDIQGGVTHGQSSPFSEYIATDKIQLNIKSLATTMLLKYVVDGLTSLIIGGNSYYSALLRLCQDLHLSLVPKVQEKGTMMCISHCNPWAKPDKIFITPSEYTAIGLSNMSRQSTTIDGIVVPNNGDTTAPTTNFYTFYGQYKSKDGQIHTVTKDTLAQLSKTTSLKFAQRPLPSWLKGVATDRKDAIERICKEYFAQEALTQQQLTLTIPTFGFTTPTLEEVFEYVGKTLEIWCPAKDNVDLYNIEKHDKYYAFCQNVTFTMSLLPKYIDTRINLSLSHVRSPELQEALGFNNDADLLYSVS